MTTRQVQIDLGEATSALPAGTYRYICEEAELRDTQDGSAQMIYSRHRCIFPDANAGAVLFNNSVLIQKAMWAVERFLRAHGVEVPSERDDRASFMMDCDELVGVETLIQVGYVEEFANNNLVNIWPGGADRDLGPTTEEETD